MQISGNGGEFDETRPPIDGILNGRSAKETRGLREACIEEALAIIEESGIEELNLREVARRLGAVK